MKLQIRLIIYTFLVACVAFPLIASADSDDRFRFTYVAQFTCGFDPQAVFVRVLPGQYATSIAVNNANKRKSQARVSVSLTFPPGGLQPGLTSTPVTLELQPNEAATVACDQLPTDFFPDLDFPPYVQGVVIIEGNRRLAVSATYTAAEVNPEGTFSIKSIDVEKIERTR